MKITINSAGLINRIDKEISQKTAYATSIDLYKFSKVSSEIFFKEVNRIIGSKKRLNEWTEKALNNLLQKQRLKMLPLDIAGEPWAEIDNHEDLAQADEAFSGFDTTFKDKRVAFIDLDGTVYIGDRLIDGVKQFLEFLRRKRIAYYFLSNNSSRSKAAYVKKLSNLGVRASSKKIILSTDGVIEYLTKKKIKNVYVVGTQSMKRMFRKAGIDTASNKPKYVILGYDTELVYEKIKKAALFLRNGVDLIATHPDVNCPTPQGLIPDIGSMISLFKKATEVSPVKIFGKPNPEMINHILTRHKISPKGAVIIGDRLYTDMALADKAGCDFVCVLSGETRREDIEGQESFPDLIVKSLRSFVE
jgi:HAD superfamily hydrolase (TIGR01450 family)